MLFRFKIYVTQLLIFTFILNLCSCAVHDHFPFICFRRGCVKDQFNGILDIGALKKRIKGKMNVRKRKRNQKEAGKTKQKNKFIRPGKDGGDDNDTALVTKGRNVDYTKYLLFFKLTSDTNHLDSLDIVHTSEHKTIIETDQSRLDHKLDTLAAKIKMVFIKEISGKDDDADVVRRRNESIRKYLHRSGISYRRIKIMKRPIISE